MKKLLKGYFKFEETVCCVAFIIMIVACIIQVCNRNITKFSIGWTEELARYAMVWMAFIGATIALRQGKQMSIEFFYDLSNKTVKKIFRVFVHTVCAMFAGITGWYSIDQIKMQLEASQVSTALRIPSAAVFSIITFCFFLMAIGEIVALILEFINKDDEGLEVKEATR